MKLQENEGDAARAAVVAETRQELLARADDAPARVDGEGEYRFNFGQMKGKTIQEALALKQDYVAHLIAGGHLPNRPTLVKALTDAGVLDAETTKAKVGAK
jgi:hypothetical protein